MRIVGHGDIWFNATLCVDLKEDQRNLKEVANSHVV